MPSGAKKRKKAKQKKDGSSLPESSMDTERNTDSEVQEDHDEDPSTPKTPVRENESGDRDRTSQNDEWVEVLDLDVGSLPSQVLEVVSGPDTTEDDKNFSDNSRLLAGWETVSQASNVEGVDELERGGTRTTSNAKNVEGEEGDPNLKFEDGLNMSQGKGAESIASDWDLTESFAEINSQDQSMQHVEEEANLCDRSSGSDGESVSECMVEITEDDTSSNLQCSEFYLIPEGPVLESDVKGVDPLLNITEDRAQEYVETRTDKTNENSPARCYGWSCEASSAVDSYVSGPHESFQFMESMVETKDHEDVEDEACVTSKSDRVEPFLSSPQGQAEFSDNEKICDEKTDGRSHTITTEESDLPPDVHSNNIAVESTHEMKCTVNSEDISQRAMSEVTGEDDKQPDCFEVEAYGGWFPVDVDRRDDVSSSKDNASHFNEISEVDYPTVETVRRDVDDVACLESKSNSGVANEDSRSLFQVESLSCSKEEPITFTTVTEVTHVNVPHVTDLSELSESGKIAERINENATVKGLSSISNLCGFLESSTEFSTSDHRVTHPHSKAAHSMEEVLPGAAESVLVVADVGEPTDVLETSEIAKPIRDTVSMNLLTETIPESDLLTRCNNTVEPVLDNLRGGASYLNLATSAEIVEHGQQNEEVSKQDAIDENQKSNEGLSSQSVVAHPEASELNSLSNIEPAEQNQLNVNKSDDYQNDGRASWKGCCGVFDWLSGRRG